ncbi:MAG: hypothetical protein LBS20_19450 [Prevotella sp.]|jgi:hypothetical protein|nr:hypothetical protein [Prevotella sp.]
MKPQWTNLENAICKYADIFQQYKERETDRTKVKNLNILTDQYNKILFLASEFSKLVEPIAPLQLKLPFDTPEFAETWKLYKEHLLERFGMYILSRRETIMLKCLKKWSNNSPDKAIEILEFLIRADDYKKFFQPTEKQLSGRELPPEEQSYTQYLNKKDFDFTKEDMI